MKTLDQIVALYSTYITARDKFRAHYGTKPSPFDYDNEQHVRWNIEGERLVNASVKAEMAYREAADEFFAKACPDLIQLLVDLDEHFEGMVDINGNGGPNMAMRTVTQIEALLGPRPVPQPKTPEFPAEHGQFGVGA